MAANTGNHGGKRANQMGRPVGSMNKDKSRPYFATIKNNILKKNPNWVEEIEYYLGVMNDPNEKRGERNAAARLLLDYTYIKPQPAETQEQIQQGFNLQWSDSAPFDPATIPSENLASERSQLN